MAKTGPKNDAGHLTDIEIAREAKMAPIEEIGQQIGIPAKSLYRYGDYKAKIANDFIESLDGRPEGKLILVTAMTPTPAGEGKTTTSIGLADGLNRIGEKTIVCLREPSLGPCFGVKGGATGGGRAQIVPMEEINLHFTGDFHAISTANNLLASLVDNHVYWSNDLKIDPRRISWRRVMDMNDRALRSVVCSLGGVANGFPREDGFDITPASEVMAILCLAKDPQDLTRRLGNIVVGHTRDRQPVRARELKADGPMAVLLRDALMPNLVQTLENTPAIIHGGPFANIAHGCNSVIATRTALRLADYVVTEAGFGADLGAEKFFDIKCRQAGLKPDAVVLVATVRALKMHGGVAKGDLDKEDLGALEKGIQNLERHVENLRNFGVPQVVAVNQFPTDTAAEIDFVRQKCAELEARFAIATHWANGGAGAEELAREVIYTVENRPSNYRPLYPDNLPLWDKVRTVAQMIYGARGIIADQRVRDQFALFQEEGFGEFPVCIAKTQYSFSTDPSLKGAPSNHVVPVREIRLAGGAEFLVVLCGEIMTMPGLPRVPAANNMFVDDRNRIEGLF